MPAGEGYVLDLARAVRDVYRAAEDELLGVVATEVARDADPERAQAEALAVARIGAVANRIVGRLEGQVEGLVGTALDKAWKRGQAEAGREIRVLLGRAAFRDSRTFARTGALAAFARATVEKLRGTHALILRQAVDAYRAAVRAATLGLVAGARPQRLTAAKRALAALADRGVVGFTDKRGRRWELASYVEMAVRSAGARTLVEGHVDRLATQGITLVVVSDHRQECELCRPFEGKVLRVGPGPTGRVQVKSMVGPEMLTVLVTATLDEARLAGFQHPNCRHSVSGYLPGATKLPAAGTTEDPEGDEARQQHRYLERGVRHWKKRAIAAQAAGDDLEARRAKSKVRVWQSRIRDHVAETGLNRLPNRERVGVAR